MSTSPEAKQAAEELRARYRGALIYGDEGLWQAVAEGYDAATAKLREAFEQYVANEGGMNFEKFAAIMRGQQLAHQQPSAKPMPPCDHDECPLTRCLKTVAAHEPPNHRSE